MYLYGMSIVVFLVSYSGMYGMYLFYSHSLFHTVECMECIVLILLSLAFQVDWSLA